MKLNFNKMLILVSLTLLYTNSQAMNLRQLRATCARILNTSRLMLPKYCQAVTSQQSIASKALATKTQKHPKLDSFAYRIKAQAVLNSTLALGKGLPNDYKNFLNEHASLEKK